MVVKCYLKKPLFYISFFLILIALFIGGKDQIEWYQQNLAYLSGNIPIDVNITSVQKVVDLFSGYDVFMNGIGYGNSGFYPVLVMLVIGFLFTCDYSQRLADGSGITEITRIGYKKYHQKKVFQNFMTTFGFVTIALMVFLMLCVCIFSGTLPTEGYSSARTTMTDLYYNMPFLYCVIQILNQAFFLALFSLLCMGTVCFYVNTFINRMAPLIIYLFLTVVSQLLHKFLGISWFVLFFPDLIFVPFNVEGGTALGFVGEKIIAYLLLILGVIFLQLYMYKKFETNYLK